MIFKQTAHLLHAYIHNTVMLITARTNNTKPILYTFPHLSLYSHTYKYHHMVITSGHSWLETNWDYQLQVNVNPLKPYHFIDCILWNHQHEKVRRGRASQAARSQGFSHIFFHKLKEYVVWNLVFFQDEPIFNMSRPMSGVISHPVWMLLSPFWLVDPYTNPSPSHYIHLPPGRLGKATELCVYRPLSTNSSC